MDDFLNRANNDKIILNDNFSRELLQLLSFGTCDLGADGSSRELLSRNSVTASNTKAQSLERGLDSLMTHPNIAPFVAQCSISHLVTANPAAAYIERWASAFATVRTGTLRNLMSATQSAHASDHKAQACRFLYGGNDGLNTTVLTDDPRHVRHGQHVRHARRARHARHAQYPAVRGGARRCAAVRGALALPRASLSALTGSD